jgi:hypothetical protein
MSVAQATVTHTVSQVPVRPQYGFPEPSLNMVVGNVLYLLFGKVRVSNVWPVERTVSSILNQHSTQASREALLLSRYDEIQHDSLGLIGRIRRS